jgi:hypothetical protein
MRFGGFGCVLAAGDGFCDGQRDRRSNILSTQQRIALDKIDVHQVGFRRRSVGVQRTRVSRVRPRMTGSLSFQAFFMKYAYKPNHLRDHQPIARRCIAKVTPEFSTKIK